MATMQPGPNHKWLDRFAGKWNTTMRMWMDPSAPPMETKGTAEFKWILDGRFMSQEYKGEMLMPDATGAMKKIPHSGIGFLGYDNFRNVYVGNWCDSMGTTMLVFTGNKSQDGKTMTMYGQMDEPMLDIIGRTVKYVTRIENDRKFVFSVYDLHVADDYKAFEITYEKQ
jgi:hypothetical protein